MSTNELNSKIYYKLLLFIGVFIGVLLLGKVDVSAKTWEVKGQGNTSTWEKTDSTNVDVMPNGDKWLANDRNDKFADGTIYDEAITQADIQYQNDTSKDYVIVTYKYYIFHKGSGKTYQTNKLRLYIDEGKTDTFTATSAYFDMLDAGTFSNGGWRYGAYIKLKLKKGVDYVLKFQSVGNASSLTDAYYDVEVNYPITYTVKYNKNGGSGSMSSDTHLYGTWYNLSTNTFTRTGYTFKNWNTASGGTGTTYTDGKKVRNLSSTNGATVNLYAQWTPITYTIQYNGNGATSGSTSSSTHTYDVSKSLTANGFSKTGYTFAGWNTQADGSGTSYSNKASVTNLTSTSGKTITLYAQWTPNTYYVAYNGNGATSGSMSKSTFTYNTSGTLRSNTFTRTGYTFTGWNTEKDGSGTSYSNGATVKNLTTENGKTVTLYAQWKVNTYSITYVTNGGTHSGEPSSYTVNDAITFTNPTKTHYTFGGWYKESSFTNKTTGISKGSTGDVTVYAKWTNSLPVINTVVNGGVNNSDSNVASNIPPYVSGDSLIIQVGDPFDPNDFFDYSDAETPKKDLTVTVNNPVPTDSKGNTTTAGNYTVTITVTDGAGGKSSATINVIVNDPPTLTAKDRWFYTGEVVDEDEILAKVSAVDYEDGDITSSV